MKEVIFFHQPFSNGSRMVLLLTMSRQGDSAVYMMDALREQGVVSAVLVQRHGAYMTGHVKARLLAEGVPPQDVEIILLARNYARREPDCMWPLTRVAAEECDNQGSRFAMAGMRPVEIIGSNNGRGPHTGQCISEGFSRMTDGIWIPFRCDAAVDYPVYDYDRVYDVLWTSPDFFVGEWLNGKQPDLVPGETPEKFERRVMSFIHDLLQKDGLRVVTTHFEIITLVHALCVAKQKRGEIDETWTPVKNGGVVIWKKADGVVMACDYTPDYDLVGKPVEVNMSLAFGYLEW